MCFHVLPQIVGQPRDTRDAAKGVSPSWSACRPCRSSSNFIAGDEALPQEWSELERLVFVNLADNELSGTLPRDVSPFLRLQYLHMSNNNIRGALPSNLARLQYM